MFTSQHKAVFYWIRLKNIWKYILLEYAVSKDHLKTLLDDRKNVSCQDPRLDCFACWLLQLFSPFHPWTILLLAIGCCCLNNSRLTFVHGFETHVYVVVLCVYEDDDDLGTLLRIYQVLALILQSLLMHDQKDQNKLGLWKVHLGTVFYYHT